MRIRSTKPDFWKSDDVAALPWEARLVFLGLWSYVDDNGVGRDNERLIVSELFPLDDPRETLARVSRALEALSDRFLIVRYSDPEGRKLLWVTGWHHQKIDRPSKPRYTLPTSEDIEFAKTSRHTRDTLATPHRGLALGTGNRDQGTGIRDQGVLPKGELHARTRTRAKAPAHDYPQAFEAFWATYPNRRAKLAALRAWSTAVKRADAEVITEGARRFAADPNRDPAYTPHPASWLNAGRWTDEPLPDRQATPTSDARAHAALALVQRFETEERRDNSPELEA